MPVKITRWVDSGGIVRTYVVYNDGTESQITDGANMETILASCGNQSSKQCITRIKVVVISDGVSSKSGGATLIGWEF